VPQTTYCVVAGSSGGLLPPSPPGEKPTAHQDQAGHLKVWSVSGGLPLRERAKQRQAYGHQELRRWREFLGIPTYVFEGELFWGQDRLQMLEWRLTQKLGSPKGAPPKG
jgi:hypothetical protein